MKRARSWCGALALCAALLCGSCRDAAKPAAPAPPAAPPAAEDEAQFSGARAYAHCAALCELGPRPTGSAAYAQQVAYISRHLQQAGWLVHTVDFSPLPGRKMQNVHATFGAPGHKPLLLSCHIDTKGQGADAILGADDGASGAAALLELARVLALQPQLAGAVELAFFDGEEAFATRMSESDGLYGSKHDVARRGMAQPRWMINLDMVGGAGKTIAVPVFDTTPEMLEQYQTAVKSLGLSEDRWTFHPGSYLDDHLPFLEAGVDVLNLIALFKDGTWWHTPKDDMSRISAPSLAETGRLVLQIIRQLLENK